MKKNINKKRIIVVSLAVLLLAVVIVGIGSSLASPNSQSDIKKVDGLTFENATVEYINNLSTFTVDVYNDNKTTYNLKSIDIILEDKDGSTITLSEEINSLQPDEGRKIIIDNIDYDLNNYTKITYKINK